MGGSRRILGALVLAALVSGLHPGSSSSGAGGPTLTSRLTEPDIRYGARTKLRGKLTGHAGGDRNRLLRIEASPFPYDEFEEIRTVTTGFHGLYSTELHPRLNTHYRVRLASDPSVSSASQTVFVAPKDIGVRLRFAGRRKVRARMILDVWRKHPYRFAGRKLRFYFRKLGNRRFRHVDNSRTMERAPGKIRGKGSFRVPGGRYRFVVTWCFETDRRDIGVGRPAPKRCPRGSVPVGFFSGRAVR